ncbi:MAG TPA: hypothetical protein VFC42_08965 [Methylomirabilota bacterium]|nr:hypothetical protein [Methylomirabilota bacterium]
MTSRIGTAADLLTRELLARWTRRRSERADAVLGAIWRRFVEAGGPVPVAGVVGEPGPGTPVAGRGTALAPRRARPSPV